MLKQTFCGIKFAICMLIVLVYSVDINDFVNKFSRIGSNREKHKILTSRKFPAIRYLYHIKTGEAIVAAT